MTKCKCTLKFCKHGNSLIREELQDEKQLRHYDRYHSAKRETLNLNDKFFHFARDEKGRLPCRFCGKTYACLDSLSQHIKGNIDGVRRVRRRNPCKGYMSYLNVRNTKKKPGPSDSIQSSATSESRNTKKKPEPVIYGDNIQSPAISKRRKTKKNPEPLPLEPPSNNFSTNIQELTKRVESLEARFEIMKNGSDSLVIL